MTSNEDISAVFKDFLMIFFQRKVKIHTFRKTTSWYPEKQQKQQKQQKTEKLGFTNFDPEFHNVIQGNRDSVVA